VRIAIDATSMPPQPAGAGVYAMELVSALAAQERRDGYALFVRGAALDAVVGGRRNWHVEHVDAASRPARLIWEQVRLPRALDKLRIDVLHSTHHTLPLAGVRCCRVVTVHDVTFLRMPERYPPARRLYMQTLTRLSARFADAVIVPSNTVRDDVRRLLGVPYSKIAVVYEAAGPQYRPIDKETALAVAREYGIEAPYVLSVGSLEPGKNRARLFRAMRELRDGGTEFRLAVVGQRAWRYEEELALVEQLGLSDRIVLPGYVKAKHLPALYAGAEAFAFPSLYEGFGLPVLESMACGVPVLTSNVSATAEVAGDAALLVDPTSVGAIRDGLRRLLDDADLRADLARRGIERAGHFTWVRAAEETRAVYRRVVAGGPAL
jgi:glycosyltransferase involved in cell wall biosynthesis